MGGNGVTSLDDSSDGIDVDNGVDTGEVLGFTDGIGVDSSIGAIVGLCVYTWNKNKRKKVLDRYDRKFETNNALLTSCLKGVTANTKSSLSV